MSSEGENSDAGASKPKKRKIVAKVMRDPLIPPTIKPYFLTHKSVPCLTKDYDCVGFEMDNCLIKFNTLEWIKLLVEGHLTELHTSCVGYPEQVTEINFD